MSSSSSSSRRRKQKEKQDVDLSAYSAYFREYALLIEYKQMVNYAPRGVYVCPGKDASVWHGMICLRQGMYKGGCFKFEIQIPALGSASRRRSSTRGWRKGVGASTWRFPFRPGGPTTSTCGTSWPTSRSCFTQRSHPLPLLQRPPTQRLQRCSTRTGRLLPSRPASLSSRRSRSSTSTKRTRSSPLTSGQTSTRPPCKPSSTQASPLPPPPPRRLLQRPIIFSSASTILFPCDQAHVTHTHSR